MNIKTPKEWRKGQTIFNFLEWLRTNGEGTRVTPTSMRMADPFHISDERLDELYEQFLKEYE